MQAGWSSPIIPRLLSPSSPIKVQENDILWLENSYILGALVALIPFAYLSNKIGRKKTILVACALCFLGWILMIFASTAEALIVARFIGGLGGVINYITTPVSIAEISHKNIRGRLGSIIFVMGPVGTLLVYSIGPYIPITNTNIAGAIVVLIQLLTFPTIPENPYYLLIEKKEEATRDNLKALRANVRVERVDMSSNRLNDIKRNRKAFLITFVLNTSSNFGGYNVLTMNMEVILSSVSANISAATIAILFAVLTIVSCLLGTLSLDHLGRKAILIASCFSGSILLILIAVYFTAKSYVNGVTQFVWIPIVIILCYAIVITGGIGLILVLLSSEIFPTNLTALGCAFGAGIYNIHFYIFGAYMLFSGIFCILVMPETRQKTLHEIQTSLIALPDGMQVGWSSPIIPRLLLPSSPIKIEDDYVVWIENSYMIGGLCGLGITIYLLDKIGRKKTILVAAVQSFLAWILMALARTPWMLLLGRLIAGMSGDINYITTPVYIAEISHKSVRGGLESTVFIMMHVGILLVYCIGPYISILNTSIVGAVVSVVQFFMFLGMPESPYYLLMKEREEEARKSLVILRASQNVEEEFKSMSEAVNEENMNPTRLLDLFSVKSNRKGLMVTIVLKAAQDFSGMTVLVMNFQTILDDVSSTVSPTLVPIIFALLVAISSMIGAVLMDLLGRKKLLIWSCFSTSILLFIIASYFTVISSGTKVKQFSWVPITVFMLYAVTQKSGIGLVPDVITAELFPTNVKAYGCAAGDASYIVGSALSIFLYSFLVNNTGIDTPFYLFAICTALCGAFAISVVPETKGRSLYEIQKILKGELEYEKF